MESKCLNLRGGGCGASKDSKVHSYDSSATISAGLPSAAQQQHERPEAILGKRARVGDTVAAQEMAGAPVAKRATGLAAPATADVSALTTKASQPVQESTIIKLSGAADKLDGSSKKAMQTFLHLPSHQMASNININQCDAVRLTADSAVSTRCSQSTFETPIVSVVEALGPLVGKPEFEGDTNTLLEILRFLILGVGAGTRAKGENLFNQCGALVAALKKPAGRAALVQVRGGSSPAEQGMHIAMAEAAVRTLPRPKGDQYKAAKAALRLTVSIAKSAATMSLDPNLLTSLQDCVQLAGNATSPTLANLHSRSESHSPPRAPVCCRRRAAAASRNTTRITRPRVRLRLPECRAPSSDARRLARDDAAGAAHSLRERAVAWRGRLCTCRWRRGPRADATLADNSIGRRGSAEVDQVVVGRPGWRITLWPNPGFSWAAWLDVVRL
jgi:hypothetical protein